MLKEVTCSCFWGEGIRVVRLKEKVREASCMNACRFFLLTSLAFPYIKIIIVPVLKFLVHSYSRERRRRKKKPAMADLFFISFTDTKSERMQSCLKVRLPLGCPNGLSPSSSVLIGFQTRRLVEPLPFVSVCLRHLRACLTSCCMCRVIWARVFRHVFVIPCSCPSLCFVLHLQCKSLCQTSQH